MISKRQSLTLEDINLAGIQIYFLHNLYNFHFVNLNNRGIDIKSKIMLLIEWQAYFFFVLNLKHHKT